MVKWWRELTRYTLGHVGPGAVVTGDGGVVEGGLVARLALQGQVFTVQHHQRLSTRLRHVGVGRVGHYYPALLYRGHHTRSCQPQTTLHSCDLGVQHRHRTQHLCFFTFNAPLVQIGFTTTCYIKLYMTTQFSLFAHLRLCILFVVLFTDHTFFPITHWFLISSFFSITIL